MQIPANFEYFQYILGFDGIGNKFMFGNSMKLKRHAKVVEKLVF